MINNVHLFVLLDGVSVVVCVCYFVLVPIMANKRETPQQMLGRADSTTQGSGRRQRSPGQVSSRSSPSSPLLDYVRNAQMAAQEQRTSSRIRELTMGQGMSTYDLSGSPVHASGRSATGISLDVTPTAIPVGRLESRHHDDGTPSVVPATVVRRNITQRRSRGKEKDDGTIAPDPSILSRRPRSRSKDRRYSIEAEGLTVEDCERQDWRSASAVNRPTPISSEFKELDVGLQSSSRHHAKSEEGKFQSERNSSKGAEVNVRSRSLAELPERLSAQTPFLREQIPSEESDPELHRVLTQYWYERQEAVRGLGDALASDNPIMYNELMNRIDLINMVMYQVSNEKANHRKGVGTVLSPGRDDDAVSSSSSSDHSLRSEPKYRQVDSLPLEEFQLPVRSLKKSYKEIHVEAFTIQLVYQGVEVYRIANHQMPLKVLYSMARSYLRTDFGFNVLNNSEIRLSHNDQLLPLFGVMGDVPVRDQDIIEVEYPLLEEMDRFGPGGNGGNNPGTMDHGQHQAVIPIGTPLPQGAPLPPAPEPDVDHEFRGHSSPSLDSKSYDKIRQSFRCPKFSGQAREWKPWNKGFMRYLSIWELDYVLDPDFFAHLPLSTDQRRDNKLVYYVIEDAVQNSPLATSYVRQAGLNNGFEAYYTLHDGYVFAGATTATLLLNELSNFRFLPNESPTELCLRLEELFQELKMLPGDAAVTFIDTQQIGYLLNALRHEKEWEHVCSTITSRQIEGNITFRQACDELKFRCEASRVHELLDKPIKGKRVQGLVCKAEEGVEPAVDSVSEKVLGLISSMSKRLNLEGATPAVAKDGKKGKKKVDRKECLVADCLELTAYPLCPLHYHTLVSAKSSSLTLRNGYGDAIFDPLTNLIVYPARTPTDRLPSKVKKVLAN